MLLNVDQRKKTEIEYYDKRAKDWKGDLTAKKKQGDFEGFSPIDLSSYQFCYELLKKNCKGKKVLDYGCGNGVHSVVPIIWGAEKVIGIDLSEASLRIAREKIQKEGLGDKVEFMAMDCEKLAFPDNSFDIIFDGGTFSSLDLNLALPELARVLKPDGLLLGIETFGHNPITNLKRKINKISGKRTGWAAEHILRMENLKKAKDYFNNIEVYYFHLISWLAFPFLGLPGSKILLKTLEGLDRFFLTIPFLRKYSFKVVFVFSWPRKYKNV
ncbi:MAG: methyltransferase domain-containing protein [bacterium]|nr:methyltransferase domain-containing protein [bacterium]